MDQDRDLFLSEYIINYLQSIYPEIYGDDAVINNYVKYKYLIDKKRTEKLSDNEKQELEQLYIYFYGNSDGSSSASGASIAANYIKTINIIKDIITKNDNAVKDSVKSIVEILSIDTPVSDEAFKKYINQVILPELIQNDEISYKINYKIKSENKVINPTITVADLKAKKKAEEEAKKTEVDAKKAEIAAKKAEIAAKTITTTTTNNEIREKIKEAAINANKEATSNLSKASISFAETAINIRDKLKTNNNFKRVIDKIIEINDKKLLCAIICTDFDKFKYKLIIDINSIIIKNDEKTKGSKYITSIQIRGYINDDFDQVIKIIKKIIGTYNKFKDNEHYKLKTSDANLNKLIKESDEKAKQFRANKTEYEGAFKEYENTLNTAKKNLESRTSLLKFEYSELFQYINDQLKLTNYASLNIDTEAYTKLTKFNIEKIYELLIKNSYGEIIYFDEIIKNPLFKLKDLLQNQLVKIEDMLIVKEINTLVEMRLEKIKKDNYLYSNIILNEDLTKSLIDCDCEIINDVNFKQIIENLLKLNQAFNINNIKDLNTYTINLLKLLEETTTTGTTTNTTAIVPIDKPTIDMLSKMSELFINAYKPIFRKSLDKNTKIDNITKAILLYYMHYDEIADITNAYKNPNDSISYMLYITLLIPLLLKYKYSKLTDYDIQLIKTIYNLILEFTNSRSRSTLNDELYIKINTEIKKQYAHYELKYNSLNIEKYINSIFEDINTYLSELNELDELLTKNISGGKKIKKKIYRGGDGNTNSVDKLYDIFLNICEIIYRIIFIINYYTDSLIKYYKIFDNEQIKTELDVISKKIINLKDLLLNDDNQINAILDNLIKLDKSNIFKISNIKKLKESYSIIKTNENIKLLSKNINGKIGFMSDNKKLPIYISYFIYTY